MITEVVLVAGGSGSGKTTDAKYMKEQFELKGKKVIRFAIDHFYKFGEDEIDTKPNKDDYDSPDAFLVDVLIEQIKTLAQGGTVKRPRYKMAGENSKREGTKTFSGEKVDVIIIEGLIALTPEILEILEPFLSELKIHLTKIFIDMDPDEMLELRKQRDVKEKEASPEDVDDRDVLVRPIYKAIIEPTKENADIVIRNKPNTTLFSFFQEKPNGKIRELKVPKELIEPSDEIVSQICSRIG